MHSKRFSECLLLQLQSKRWSFKHKPGKVKGLQHNYTVIPYMFHLTVVVFHVGLQEHVGIYGIDCFFLGSAIIQIHPSRMGNKLLYDVPI